VNNGSIDSTDLADGAGFEILDEFIARDLEARLREALALGAVFGPSQDPLTVFRGAVRSSIRDIELHPRGRLLQRFLKEGPYEGEGDIPPEMAARRLTDRETASAVNFVFFYMVNSFQGRLAELLAAAPCARLLGRLKAAGRVPAHAGLYVGDTVQIGIRPCASGAKGADMHVLVVEADRDSARTVDVVGVAEVKSYPCSRRVLETQLDRHLSRLKAGMRLEGVVVFPHRVRVAGGTGGKPVRIAVTASSWKLPTSFRFVTSGGVRRLVVDPGAPPRDQDRFEASGDDWWHLVLRWSHEALASAAYEMTFWYMEKVGEVIYSQGVIPEWSEMPPAEAGRNAAKMMLYYAILRSRTRRQEQRALALYNTYGFGYALGMNFVNADGNREMLWPEDLDEIAATGRTAGGCRIRGSSVRRKGEGAARSPAWER
jgi:hypothetical protein